ncbi:unnamed protein product [Oikopleura dioica]|uniref:Carboxylesterase type B domain-containing protein n=1 Tax=Oikopleura dioica TaxID=34765 RepID=E4XV59_OIKDI|nr:unnamed protein product [Oikopleura dioica]
MRMLSFLLGTAFASITKYAGVPYALPPVGNLRWQKPVSNGLTLLQAIDARINGDRAACIQQDGGGNEDCLYLDIVKPDSIASGTLLPIYFWIHGGHFRNGAGGWYGGEPLGNSEEMIVVTIQYRLGPLGFLNYPRYMGNEVPLNIGLYDQRMALKFIYDYAETIGGDKNRITVSGESAGGISTSAHAFAPPSAIYIAQTIQQSGSAALGGQIQWTNTNMEDLLKYLCTVEISCPAWVDVSQTIQYLRTLEFGTDDFWKMYYVLGTSSAGIINDDRDFFGGQTLQEIIDAKSFKIMPTMIFFTAFEGTLSVGEYPTKYNKDNFMNVWSDLDYGSLLYSHKDLSFEDKQALTWRSFGRMSCDFPDETPASAGIINDDRDFFGGQMLQEIIDAKSFKIMPTIIFFTAFEGSLSVGEYPTKYNKDNFMNVWSDLDYGSLLYSHKGLTFEDKQALTWRSFGRMSCDFPDETPARFEDIDDKTAVRLTLDIYGDIMFRGPGIKVASEYYEQGADTWIIHFDTTEGGDEWSKERVIIS